MTLADLSAWLRAALKWVLLATVILIVLWIGWVAIIGISSTIFKPKGADTAFGVLDPPIFTKTLSSFKSDKYEIDTPLPKANAKLEAFQMEKNAKSSQEQQKQLTSLFGVSSAKKTEEDGLITWKHSSSGTILKLNTSSNHFTFKRSYSKDKNLLKTSLSLNKDQSLKKANDILKKLNIKLKDKNLDEKNAVVKFYSLTTSNREETQAASANAVEIQFFRKVGKALSTGDAPIRLLLASKGNSVLEFDYHYSPLNSTGAPYPIISSSKAWEEVKEGNSFTESRGKFSSIKVIGVASSYWDSKFYQPYLQPVWIFSGVGQTTTGEVEFQAFVPAVNSEYLSQTQEPPP